MCRAVIERGRADRQRCRWIDPGRFKLEVVQSGRFNFAFSQRTKPLLDAPQHKGLFVRRQAFAFPAPTEMLQPRLCHCFPPAWFWLDGATCFLSDRRVRTPVFEFTTRISDKLD